MTDEKPKNEGDRLIIKPELLTAPEAQRSGVIGDNGNQARWEKAQEVHNLGDNSATGLFYPPGTAPATEKFGIVGLDDKAPKKNANGTPYTVYTQEAGQALNPIGQIHKPLTEGAHQSAVKLNVGITQVPEVTTGVTPQDALKYTSTVMEAGAQAVRQTEEHLAKPGAVNRDLLDMALAGSKLPGYLTNTEQLQKDVKSLITGAAQKVEEVVQTIDKPMTPEQRAKMAGTMLPLFFFEGGKEPIDQKVAQQMKLEQMTDEELGALKIQRKLAKIEPAEGREIVSSIHRDLEINHKRNVAVAEVDVTGKRQSLIGVSGEDSPVGTLASPTDRLFTTRNRGAILTGFDSEVKILEDIAKDLPRDARGCISLFTERKPCYSCADVVTQFREMFPNIELNVTYGRK